MNLPKAPFQVTLLRDETSIEAVCVGIHETSDERPALVCLQLESRSLTDPSFGNKWYIVNSRGERVEGRYTNFAQAWAA
jgi:hypothetical protein